LNIVYTCHYFKVVILLTGGPSADVYYDAAKDPIKGADLLKMPTDQLHNAEVAVYAVGVQDGLSDNDKKTFTEQLGIIASQPTADHVFEVADYAKLAETAPKVANKSCVGTIKTRGGTPLYTLYRYVPPDRVGFLRCSVLK